MNIKKILDTTKETPIIFRASGLPGFRASGLPGFRASGLPGDSLTIPFNAAARGAIFQKLHSLRIFIFFVALILDRATKFCAESRLLPDLAGGTAVFPSLRLYHNYGMTFSLLRYYPSLCAILALTAVGMLSFVCLKNREIRSMPGVVLLLAGAFGNLTDRLLYGYVVDWIYVGGYINLADVWIGVGCLMICAQFIHINRRRFLR